MPNCKSHDGLIIGYGSIPINTIFRGMNIHLPAILMFTRGTRVLTHPHIVCQLKSLEAPHVEFLYGDSECRSVHGSKRSQVKRLLTNHLHSRWKRSFLSTCQNMSTGSVSHISIALMPHAHRKVRLLHVTSQRGYLPRVSREQWTVT